MATIKTQEVKDFVTAFCKEEGARIVTSKNAASVRECMQHSSHTGLWASLVSEYAGIPAPSESLMIRFSGPVRRGVLILDGSNVYAAATTAGNGTPALAWKCSALDRLWIREVFTSVRS
jgi:hypothetical protein